MISRARALRELLNGPDLALIMEAHNGLVARICERNGFRALWASGLCLSSSMGLRDNSEATWTELAEIAEHLVSTTSLPVLFDGDSGHGNYSNVRRLVRTLSERGFAGVVIEDKTFPKMNSFIPNQHELVSIGEFQGKMRAAKDAQVLDDFMVIARLEGFISGRGLSDVVERAQTYSEAGADGLFVHSKRKDVQEIAAFMSHCRWRIPILIAPTTYPQVRFDTLKQLGVAGAICANHALRAAIQAIDDVTRCVRAADSLAAIEDRIAPLSQIFDLLNYDELETAEQLYGWVPVPEGEASNE
jgi:phosphoenolpyruvate phosphomutase